jgi:hypothetical protein
VNGQLPIHVMPNRDASSCEQNLDARVFLMEKYPEGLKIKDKKEKSHHTMLSSAIREEETYIVDMIALKFSHMLQFKLKIGKTYLLEGTVMMMMRRKFFLSIMPLSIKNFNPQLVYSFSIRMRL